MPAGFLILDTSIDRGDTAETTVQQSSGDQGLVSVPVLAKTEQLMIQNDEIFQGLFFNNLTLKRGGSGWAKIESSVVTSLEDPGAATCKDFVYYRV